MHTRQKLESALHAINAWSWPAKFLLGAAVSAFAGGGFLGFAIQNAAYYYALHFGFRPPVEGVPYLTAMVTVGSISLMLLSALIAASVIWSVRKISTTSSAMLARKQGHRAPLGLLTQIQSMKFVYALPLLLLISTGISFVEVQLLAAWGNHIQLCSWPLLLCSNQPRDSLPSLVGLLAINMIIGLMIWRPSMVWVGTLALVGSQYAAIASAALPPDGYARLLRMTGFGGGIEVSLELNSLDAGAPVLIDANLLMRSSAHVYLYSPDLGVIREYPLSSIRQIRYKHGGLDSLQFTLPPPARSTNRHSLT